MGPFGLQCGRDCAGIKLMFLVVGAKLSPACGLPVHCCVKTAARNGKACQRLQVCRQTHAVYLQLWCIAHYEVLLLRPCTKIQSDQLMEV